MTEHTDSGPFTPPADAPTAPPPSYAVRPPLRRTRDDRVIGGVAAGFARWLGIDPVIVRVVLVVLAVFGGSGLLLYGAGWLFIPEEGEQANEAQKILEGSGRPGSTGRVALIIVAVGVGVLLLASLSSFGPGNGVWFFGGGGSVLLLIAAGGLVLWLVNRDKNLQPPLNGVSAPGSTGAAAMAQTAPASTTEPTDTQPTGYAYGGYGGYPGYVSATTTPIPPRAPKPRSYLGAATLSVALVAMGVLVTLNITRTAAIPVVVVLATGLGVLGLGLIVGTVFGRARWLLSIAIPLLVVTALVALVPTDLRLGTQIADRSWSPSTPSATVDEFRVDIGQGQLDLTDLVLPPGTTTYPISASVGIGNLEVVVPEGVRVLIDAGVGAGRIAVEGLPEVSGTDQSVATELPGAVTDTPTIDLTLEVGLGNLEVSRA